MNYYLQEEVKAQIVQQNQEKMDNLRARVKHFEVFTDLQDARAYAIENFRLNTDYQEFSVGNVKCTIVNKEDRLRISYDSSSEFISYDFA